MSFILLIDLRFYIMVFISFFWGDQTVKPNGLSIRKDYFDHEIEKEKNFFIFLCIYFWAFYIG